MQRSQEDDFFSNVRIGSKLYFTVVRLNNVMYDEPCLTDRKIQNYPLSFPVEQDPVCQTF